MIYSWWNYIKLDSIFFSLVVGSTKRNILNNFVSISAKININSMLDWLCCIISFGNTSNLKIIIKMNKILMNSNKGRN